MNERPIIFSGPMVRAILDGHKTQTRRVVKPQPDNPNTFGINPVWGHGTITSSMPGVLRGDIPARCVDRFTIHAAMNVNSNRVDRWIPCPFGKIGDRLWVRETFFPHRLNGLVYRADDPHELTVSIPGKWHSPYHITREQSRLTLDIVGLRVEQVQAISNADAVAEGMNGDYLNAWGGRNEIPLRGNGSGLIAEEQFAKLWDELNAARGYPWSSNPWVWVIEFERTPHISPHTKSESAVGVHE